MWEFCGQRTPGKARVRTMGERLVCAPRTGNKESGQRSDGTRPGKSTALRGKRDPKGGCLILYHTSRGLSRCFSQDIVSKSLFFTRYCIKRDSLCKILHRSGRRRFLFSVFRKARNAQRGRGASFSGKLPSLLAVRIPFLFLFYQKVIRRGGTDGGTVKRVAHARMGPDETLKRAGIRLRIFSTTASASTPRMPSTGPVMPRSVW